MPMFTLQFYSIRPTSHSDHHPLSNRTFPNKNSIQIVLKMYSYPTGPIIKYKQRGQTDVVGRRDRIIWTT